VFTVTTVTTAGFVLGMVLTGGTFAAGTIITSQLTGTPGGVGTYAVSISQTVSTAVFTGTTATLTVGGTVTGTFLVGMFLQGTGITSNAVVITAFGTGTGGAGTYAVRGVTAAVGSTAISGGGTLTVSAVASGALSVGTVITGTSVTAGCTILALGAGSTGGSGTYIVSHGAASAGSTAITGIARLPGDMLAPGLGVVPAGTQVSLILAGATWAISGCGTVLVSAIPLTAAVMPPLYACNPRLDTFQLSNAADCAQICAIASSAFTLGTATVSVSGSYGDTAAYWGCTGTAYPGKCDKPSSTSLSQFLVASVASNVFTVTNIGQLTAGTPLFFSGATTSLSTAGLNCPANDAALVRARLFACATGANTFQISPSPACGYTCAVSGTLGAALVVSVPTLAYSWSSFATTGYTHAAVNSPFVLAVSTASANKITRAPSTTAWATASDSYLGYCVAGPPTTKTTLCK